MSEADHEKVPKFKGNNYNIWKVRMGVYLRSLGMQVYVAICVEYIAPTIIIPAIGGAPQTTGPKPVETYTAVENALGMANAKAMNALIRALDEDGINRISSFTSARVIWEALRIAYEGDEVVKEQQVQAFQTRFEDLRMKENEKFDDFYLRLYTIVNQAAGVGYTFDQITIVRKIIRVVPRSRFG